MSSLCPLGRWSRTRRRRLAVRRGNANRQPRPLPAGAVNAHKKKYLRELTLDPRLRTAWLLDVGTKLKQVSGLPVRMAGKRLQVVRHGAVVRLEVGEGGAGKAELSSFNSSP